MKGSMAVNIKEFKKQFTIKDAIARMMGINTIDLVLEQSKNIFGGVDLEIKGTYPDSQRATCNDINNPWRKIEEEAGDYAEMLIEAINDGKLLPVNFNGCLSEIAEIDYHSALFNKSDITKLLSANKIHDLYFNPNPAESDAATLPIPSLPVTKLISVGKTISFFGDMMEAPETHTPKPAALSVTTPKDKPKKKPGEVPADVYHNLGKVKNDYSKYKACLKTEKQKAYFSLWYEYERTKMDIAKRMEVKHQGVPGAIGRAVKNVLKAFPNDFRHIYKTRPIMNKKSNLRK